MTIVRDPGDFTEAEMRIAAAGPVESISSFVERNIADAMTREIALETDRSILNMLRTGALFEAPSLAESNLLTDMVYDVDGKVYDIKFVAKQLNKKSREGWGVQLRLCRPGRSKGDYAFIVQDCMLQPTASQAASKYNKEQSWESDWRFLYSPTLRLTTKGMWVTWEVIDTHSESMVVGEWPHPEKPEEEYRGNLFLSARSGAMRYNKQGRPRESVHACSMRMAAHYYAAKDRGGKLYIDYGMSHVRAAKRIGRGARMIDV